ncbi:MAG: polyphosphate kinase 1 [Lentisphaerae bacterium]|nr:polyphosphate kinase 1 [Lentisphaerota bacterium]
MSTRKDRFVNREMSWLEFNQRVLDEAASEDVPLLERLFFLTISGSNLDEFFMVRVGGLELLREAGSRRRDLAGFTPLQQLALIGKRARQMVGEQYALYRDHLLPSLAGVGLRILSPEQCTTAEFTRLHEIFSAEIQPVLTAMCLDGEGPFPLLQNMALYVAVQLETDDDSETPFVYAAVPVGGGLKRVWPLGRGEDVRAFALIEDLVMSQVDVLFPGRRVVAAAPFRVTRNADMSVEEEFAEDLSLEMERVLRQRRTSGCVRLEIGHKAPRELVSFLATALGVRREGLLRIEGPIDLTGLRALHGVEGFDALRYPSWAPQPSAVIDPKVSLFEQIAKQDILVSLPFERFDPIVRLVREAADDPDVLAIKQILYRTSPDSPIIQALRRAAENGKYVTTIVELKARFDEANNIAWARELESVGVQVVYGVKRFKTHGKICVVVRREREGIVRYSHFGTGNYNEKTAGLYTDVGLLTRDAELGADASAFFNAICGRSEPRPYTWLAQSPFGLRDRLLELISDETARCKQGHPASIRAKMNSLADPELIDALYTASRAGVKILLNVRGICCLRPGVKGLSETITVVSILDRYLEHSRIFEFRHGGALLTFISSADWMPRNLDRRVELLVPVRDKACKRGLQTILDAAFSDNTQARLILPDGRYERLHSPTPDVAVRSQERLYRQACTAWKQARQDRLTAFEPHLPPTT